MLQVLADLAPVFSEVADGGEPTSGEVNLRSADEMKFPWVFTSSNDAAYAISALPGAVPEHLNVPEGFKVMHSTTHGAGVGAGVKVILIAWYMS